MVTAEAKRERERERDMPLKELQSRSDLSLPPTGHWSELITWARPTARATGKCGETGGYLMHVNVTAAETIQDICCF